VSAPYDADRDDPAACAREIECDRCGVKFTVDGRLHDAMREDGWQQEFQADSLNCPACDELGQEPPKSPCCDAPMRGDDHGDFDCSCDTAYPVDAIRAYALGLAVERIVKEERRAALNDEAAPDAAVFANLIRRAAASLGIRSKQVRP
jgi:hypothetical protein